MLFFNPLHFTFTAATQLQLIMWNEVMQLIGALIIKFIIKYPFDQLTSYTARNTHLIAIQELSDSTRN